MWKLWLLTGDVVYPKKELNRPSSRIRSHALCVVSVFSVLWRLELELPESGTWMTNPVPGYPQFQVLFASRIAILSLFWLPRQWRAKTSCAIEASVSPTSVSATKWKR